MASIDISRNHKLGTEEAKARAVKLLERLGEQYKLKGTWSGNSFKITSPATGSCDVTDTAVRVQIDLPFMMRPLKGKIEERVTSELEKTLA